MSSELGKDYFLRDLQVSEDLKDKQQVQKDVTVNQNTLKQLEVLGLIKKPKKNV
jgi:hypothetical protein